MRLKCCLLCALEDVSYGISLRDVHNSIQVAIICLWGCRGREGG